MDQLLEKNLLQEVPCGANFAYILLDNSLFKATDYKVLRSQVDGSFVKCMKMLYNGKVQLYYLAGSLKPLPVVLPNLNVEGFLTVVTNLLNDILEAKNNGFLSCENVEISFDKIFVDPNTLKVSLVYVPVSAHLYENDTELENRLRSELVGVIRQTPALEGPRTLKLAEALDNSALSLEELYDRMKGGSIGEADEAKPVPPVEKKKMRIVAVNAPKPVEFAVNKDRFVLGKGTGGVDAVIDYNRMVSRVHCCVEKNNGEYMLTDLRSTNGTFVNGVKLVPNQPQTLHNGDVIKLANSKFQIVVE